MAKTSEDAMHYMEKEIGTMNEYEALRMEISDIEKAMQRRGLSLAERNAMEHLMERSAEDLAEARAEFFR
jgi:hypothetical protein